MVHYIITTHRGSSVTEVENWEEDRMMSTDEMVSRLNAYVEGGQSAILSIGTFGRHPEESVEVVRGHDRDRRVFPRWPLMETVFAMGAKRASQKAMKAEINFRLNDFDRALSGK